MTLSARQFDDVGALMREVAARAIVPRFRTLAQGEVEEKAPGELVTVADREAERLLSAELTRLYPAARVVGEEAAERRPGLLADLHEGAVWLVDPLDGTGNFVEGTPCFSVMIALLEHGEATAAWLLDPLADRLHRAQRGAGAYLDDARLLSPQGHLPLGAMRGAMLTKYMPPSVQAALAPPSARLGQVLPGLRCAGAEYPVIARGVQDFALFCRTLPWDHAPGALVLSEAGGLVLRPDGSAYRAGDTRMGLLAARNRAVWEELDAAFSFARVFA